MTKKVKIFLVISQMLLLMAYCELYPECEMCLIYFRLFNCSFLFYRFLTLITSPLEKSHIFESVCYKGAARCWLVIEFRQCMALRSCSDFLPSPPKGKKRNTELSQQQNSKKGLFNENSLSLEPETISINSKTFSFKIKTFSSQSFYMVWTSLLGRCFQNTYYL